MENTTTPIWVTTTSWDHISTIKINIKYITK